MANANRVLMEEFGCPEVVVLQDGTEIPAPWMNLNSEHGTYHCSICDNWVSDINHINKKRHKDHVAWEFQQLAREASPAMVAEHGPAVRVAQRWSAQTVRRVWERFKALQGNEAYAAPGLPHPSQPQPLPAQPLPGLPLPSWTPPPASSSGPDLSDVLAKLEIMERAQIDARDKLEKIESIHVDIQAAQVEAKTIVEAIHADIQALKAVANPAQGSPARGLLRRDGSAGTVGLPTAPRAHQ